MVIAENLMSQEKYDATIEDLSDEYAVKTNIVFALAKGNKSIMNSGRMLKAFCQFYF